jgi:hypothetical protein
MMLSAQCERRALPSLSQLLSDCLPSERQEWMRWARTMVSLRRPAMGRLGRKALKFRGEVARALKKRPIR